MKASAGRVLMLVENNFPADTRVRNEASTLVAHGYRVIVIALRGAGRAAPGGRRWRDGLSHASTDRVRQAAGRQAERPAGSCFTRFASLSVTSPSIATSRPACLGAQPLHPASRKDSTSSTPTILPTHWSLWRPSISCSAGSRCSITTICLRSCICRAMDQYRRICHTWAPRAGEAIGEVCGCRDRDERELSGDRHRAKWRRAREGLHRPQRP